MYQESGGFINIYVCMCNNNNNNNVGKRWIIEAFFYITGPAIIDWITRIMLLKWFAINECFCLQ